MLVRDNPKEKHTQMKQLFHRCGGGATTSSTLSYMVGTFSRGLLLLLPPPLLLLSWLLGGVTPLDSLSEGFGAESLSPGMMWAGPGEDRDDDRDRDGRYAAVSSDRRSVVGDHLAKPASF